MAKSLERFTVTPAADGYLLTIEDDAGGTVELTATLEQLDLISEELERALDEDDADAMFEDTDEDDDDGKDDD